MHIKETGSEGLKHEFSVTVEAAEIERQIQSRLAEIGRTARLPGFRPGKAPLAVLKQRYGSSIMGEVVERAVNDTSSAAIKERNLRPALKPKVEIVSFDEGKDLEYKLAVEVLPEIGAVDIAGLTLERWKAQVPDSEIDTALERIAKQQRKSEVVDRPAEKGDIVAIGFIGTIGGTAFPGGSAENQHLELGSGSFIPGFEDQLLGSKPGEARNLKVTFPADYGSADLAGKDAEFAVNVKEVRRVVPQPIDESLAASVGMENLAELRKAVRERIEREYAGVSRQKLKRELLDLLAARHSFPVPQGMLEIESDQLWGQLEADRQRMKETGETDPDAGKSDDELKAEYRVLAERRVRLGLLLNEIGRVNNVAVTGEEMNRALIERARGFPGQEREVLDFYRNNPQALDSLRAPLYEDKVIDIILEKSTVGEKAVPPETLVKAASGEDAADTPAAEKTKAKAGAKAKSKPKKRKG